MFLGIYYDLSSPQAMEGWGRVLQRTYGKDRDSAREQDLTVNYLGYYTDNGRHNVPLWTKVVI